MRICKICGIKKPLKGFYSNGKSKITGKVLFRWFCRKCYNLKYRPSKTNRGYGSFKKGHIPWNKGTKGILKANKGSFKRGSGIGKRFEFEKGRIPWNKGLTARGNCRGCKKYETWRTKVIERDLFKCQKCSSTERIQAHHIKSWNNFSEIRFDITNGITLCNSCHAKLHNNILAYNNKKLAPWNKGLKGVQVAWNKGTTGLIKPNSGNFKKGHIPWSKNNVFSEETRKKMSIAQKKRFERERSASC